MSSQSSEWTAMGNRSFTSPEADEFLFALGVRPELGEDGAFHVEFSAGDLVLRFSYSVPGSSVRYELIAGGRAVIASFREGARLLRVGEKGEMRIDVDFETEDTRGGMTIRVAPEISVTERTLLT